MTSRVEYIFGEKQNITNIYYFRILNWFAQLKRIFLAADLPELVRLWSRSCSCLVLSQYLHVLGICDSPISKMAAASTPYFLIKSMAQRGKPVREDRRRCLSSKNDAVLLYRLPLRRYLRQHHLSFATFILCLEGSSAVYLRPESDQNLWISNSCGHRRKRSLDSTFRRFDVVQVTRCRRLLARVNQIVAGAALASVERWSFWRHVGDKID